MSLLPRAKSWAELTSWLQVDALTLPSGTLLGVYGEERANVGRREDISANIGALEELQATYGCEMLFVESGGDNLAGAFGGAFCGGEWGADGEVDAANYSRELADYVSSRLTKVAWSSQLTSFLAQIIYVVRTCSFGFVCGGADPLNDADRRLGR